MQSLVSIKYCDNKNIYYYVWDVFLITLQLVQTYLQNIKQGHWLLKQLSPY